MDLLSEEEKELIKFFERKVQNEISDFPNTKTQHEGKEENGRQKEINKNLNQIAFQKYSQMFGSSSELKQQNMQNNSNTNRKLAHYNYEDNYLQNEQEQFRQFELPQRSLNPIFSNGDNNISTEGGYKESNSQMYYSNASNNSTLGKKNQNNLDRIQQIPSYQDFHSKQQPISNSQHLEQGQPKHDLLKQDQNRYYKSNQQQQLYSSDMNGFTFKPPTFQAISQQKELKVKPTKENLDKGREKNIKSNSKKDLSNNKIKKQIDQSITSRNNDSDKKSNLKQNTSRPASSRNPQIKNNSFINQNSQIPQTYSISHPINKSNSKTKKNSCNNSKIEKIQNQEQISKQNIKKDDSAIKNTSIYKSGSKKQADSNLKKARSSSLYISNNNINNSSIIQKDVSNHKLENVRKRSNSKSKRKISVATSQSNNQLKTDRSKISTSSSNLKRAQSREEIKVNEKKQANAQQILRQFLKVIDQNKEDGNKLMLKIIEDHLNDCLGFQKKITNIIQEQNNYNNYKSYS